MSFPEDVIDKSQYDELVGEGGTEFFSEMIELYEEHIPAIIDQLIEASKGSDTGMVKELAHSIKGSAANIGVKTVFNLSKELELGSSSMAPDEIIETASKIKAEFERSIPILKSLV